MAETFTSRGGSVYEVHSTREHICPDGQVITWHYVTMSNPESGHGWGGHMTDSDLKFDLERY